MYFDAVLDQDMRPLFNGTTEDTLKWLQDNRDFNQTYQVCDGATMRLMSVKEYLSTNIPAKRFVREELVVYFPHSGFTRCEVCNKKITDHDWVELDGAGFAVACSS